MQEQDPSARKQVLGSPLLNSDRAGGVGGSNKQAHAHAKHGAATKQLAPAENWNARP